MSSLLHRPRQNHRRKSRGTEEETNRGFQMLLQEYLEKQISDIHKVRNEMHEEPKKYTNMIC